MAAWARDTERWFPRTDAAPGSTPRNRVTTSRKRAPSGTSGRYDNRGGGPLGVEPYLRASYAYTVAVTVVPARGNDATAERPVIVDSGGDDGGLGGVPPVVFGLVGAGLLPGGGPWYTSRRRGMTGEAHPPPGSDGGADDQPVEEPIRESGPPGAGGSVTGWAPGGYRRESVDGYGKGGGGSEGESSSPRGTALSTFAAVRAAGVGDRSRASRHSPTPTHRRTWCGSC